MEVKYVFVLWISATVLDQIWDACYHSIKFIHAFRIPFCSFISSNMNEIRSLVSVKPRPFIERNETNVVIVISLILHVREKEINCQTELRRKNFDSCLLKLNSLREIILLRASYLCCFLQLLRVFRYSADVFEVYHLRSNQI